MEEYVRIASDILVSAVLLIHSQESGIYRKTIASLLPELHVEILDELLKTSNGSTITFTGSQHYSLNNI